MSAEFNIGERVEVHLDSDAWESTGWYAGAIVRIDPYSAHRSFYWVELDQEVKMASGPRTRLISVFNLGKIRRP